MTATILAILNSQAALITELIKSQTPAQQLDLWNRYLDLTAPLHALLCKIEGITPIVDPPAVAPVPVKA
jgi:hypothetical protein